MKPSRYMGCNDFPCGDQYEPSHPSEIALIMLSECAPADPNDDYYVNGEPLFAKTTLQVFRDAGEHASSMDDLIKMGVYLTTTIKCAKHGALVPKKMIANCSYLLEKEIALFPN